MALYAVDDDDLIYAGDAEPGKTYWCLDCFGPVKRRRGKYWLPHFYHLKTAPQCRLYSKTEDHLLAQIQLQKSFPEGALQMERPFIDIARIADVCWEKEKIVFEIQCSPITEKEVEMRERDYRSIGYHIVWLLDDKRYNKKVLRPAEGYLRRLSAYYLMIEKGLTSRCYDQFEVLDDGRRVKRGKRMLLDLQQVRRKPNIAFSEELFPKQITALKNERYFLGDRTDRALKGRHMTMHYWKMLETELSQKPKKQSRWKEWFRVKILAPYRRALERQIRRL